MKRLFRSGRYANVTATLALIVALGGTSYAAVSLPRNSVSAKQIKKDGVGASEIKAGAVGSSEVSDGSLLGADFKAGTLPSGAAGATGATGAKGDKGDKGDTGTTGPRGPSEAFSAGPASGPVTKTVPAGTYVVIGQSTIGGAAMANSDVGCDVEGGSGHGQAYANISASPEDDQETVVATMVTTLEAAGDLTFSCDVPTMDETSVIAIRVANAS